MTWQGAVLGEPPEILTMAVKAAASAGLVTKVSSYSYFQADGRKSPGKVLAGGLAYYLLATPDRMKVRVSKTVPQGSFVSVESKGLRGRQAVNILVGNLTRPATIS